MAFARDVPDRILFLDKGVIAAEGPPGCSAAGSVNNSISSLPSLLKDDARLNTPRMTTPDRSHAKRASLTDSDKERTSRKVGASVRQRRTV
jgi:hypothetical protein